jgi:hypothetical protein
VLQIYYHDNLLSNVSVPAGTLCCQFLISDVIDRISNLDRQVLRDGSVTFNKLPVSKTCFVPAFIHFYHFIVKTVLLSVIFMSYATYFIVCLINLFILFLMLLKNQSDIDDDSRAAGADVKHGSPQPISASPVIFKNLMAKRTIKSRANRANDEAVPTTAPRKPTVASDDRGHSKLPQLEVSLARVNASRSGDSHNTVSNALRAYDRLVLKEYRNIHFNQQKVEEAWHRIKKSQLNIERVQKSLVEDIRALVTSSKTDEVRIGTSPHDVRASK